MNESVVEWFAKQVLEYKSPTNVNGTDYILIPVDKIDFLKEQAIEMEKQNLLDMSVKSALYERKWVYEEMSDKKYKPTKVEIRDLKITALEHYNETFKSE